MCTKLPRETAVILFTKILAAGTDVHVIWRDSYCKMEAVVID